MGLRAEWSDRVRRLRLSLSEGARVRPPVARQVNVRIAGEKNSREVVFEGKPVEIRL